MDYLESKFLEELNDEGDIEIRGEIFTREEILKNFEDTYQRIFNDWKVGYTENLLNKAEDILACSDDNHRHFEKLRELFGKGLVIPFIGAGLSMESGFPSWKGFLCDVQKGMGLKQIDINELIENGDYELAAQELDNEDNVYLQDKLNDVFGKNLDLDKICGVIRRLPEFFKNTVITTNYDRLLKIIYEESNIHFQHELNGLDAQEFGRLFVEKERVLLKLHGTYTSSNKRILTYSDYERHYNENNSIQNCIGKLFSCSLLFLGCSLQQDRIIQEMIKFVASHNRDSLTKHYAFLSRNNLTDYDVIERRKFLQKANIYPIWYDDEHDECIEALLEGLKHYAH